MTDHRPFRRAYALGAAFTLVLALGACSSSSGDDEADSTTTEATTARDDDATTTTADDDDTTTTEGDDDTTTTTEGDDDDPDVAEAEALAESVNPTIDDFAEGWTEEPAEDDDEEGVAECFTSVDVDDVEVASVSSPTFSIESPDGSQGQVVQVSTIVVDQDSSAEDILDDAAADDFPACAEQTLLDSLAEDGTDATSDGFQAAPASGLSEGDAGITGTITFTGADGTDYDGEVGLHLIRTQNVISAVTLLDIGDLAFEDTLEELLTQVAANHAAEIG